MGLAASVRAAKQALAGRAAWTMPLPDASAVVLTSGLLEQAAQPALQRVAELTTEAIAAAEASVQELAVVYCVGGVARLPLLQKVLTEALPLTPIVVAEPAMAAVRGAAAVGAVDAAAAVPSEGEPVPPVRRAAGIAVPGFASLGLISQFLLTVEWHGALMYRQAWLNWGELAMAAVFAMIASLGAGTVLAPALAAPLHHHAAPMPRSVPGSWRQRPWPSRSPACTPWSAASTSASPSTASSAGRCCRSRRSPPPR
ncbi:Hsp70 family protein [Micromonospora peucetia]|uniref:Hsp70 family protein n=1 Tax=Micromonospora peucetia TaxID=47871 RepID=UPI002255F507|nr:Hsp70 family protein [Micromonospora peucetia]MCX4387290.1 Hsp70 family protein [Micromonospora peucetia]